MIINPVITVDGPSGVGKGALCKELAKILQWRLLDSGKIYRVLAMVALHYQIAIDSERILVSIANNLDIGFNLKQNQLNVILKGKNVSQIICNETIGNIASKIAVLPRVREAILQRQRAFRVMPGLIAEGRDMGTVVFPDAPVKIFLDALSEKRAHRRMQQLQKKGFDVNFDSLLSEIKERDDRDRNRAVAPLMPAVGALVIDSTHLTVNEVIVKALTHARQILSKL